MAYSTGSGTFTALMAAVAVHAVTDGWTESDGLGTGFPLEINTTFVDFDTYTASETDYTENAGGGAITSTYARLALGTSAANATTNAASVDCLIPNAGYTITAWHIFSDATGTPNYIHVVFQFSNGVNADVYQHFSFGEIDQQGMTHTGVSYAAVPMRRGYAAGIGSGQSADDWNSINRGSFPFAGAVGENDDGDTDTQYIVDGTTTGVDSAAGYPTADTVYTSGSLLWDASRMGEDVEESLDYRGGGAGWKPAWGGMNANSQMPFTGAITMSPFPFILCNGTGSGNSITWLGVFPDVRQCNMTNFAPGDEITYGSDTWKIFPWTRQTDNSFLNDAYLVTSGQAGLAYKKV